MNPTNGLLVREEHKAPDCQDIDTPIVHIGTIAVLIDRFHYARLAFILLLGIATSSTGDGYADALNVFATCRETLVVSVFVSIVTILD